MLITFVYLHKSPLLLSCKPSIEFNLKMIIHRTAIILYFFLFTWLYSRDCTCCITEIFFNENILSYHISMLDANIEGSHSVIYQYGLNIEDCSENLSINVEYKIYAPEIDITTFETFYKGSIKINNESLLSYFTNNEIKPNSGPNFAGNQKMETLISYISQTGKLPNGKYFFHFTLQSDTPLFTVSKIIDVQVPVTLELLSPGGSLSDLSNSYTYSTVPLFMWYSDYCPKCEYAIRVCEYDQDVHKSLEDALSDWSLVPMNQSQEYFPLDWNTNSFQYPSVGHIDLETGKYYLWQIRRSFNTTLEAHHDYSSINVFEVRKPDKVQMDYSDPYLSVLESIIGEEQFYLWFSPGGELERFTTTGDVIWINDEEIHIEGLYYLLTELNQGKISIENIRIK